MYMSLYIPVSIYPSWTLSNSCTPLHSTHEAQKGIIQPLKIDSVHCMYVCKYVCMYVCMCICVCHACMVVDIFLLMN